MNIMKKFNLILLAFLFLSITINARPRNNSEAMQIAYRFFSKTSPQGDIRKSPSALNAVQLLYSQSSDTSPEETLLYVFGKKESNGFVIVSGDDRSYDILGYSDSDNFDPENIPDNMKSWLDFYKAEINLLKDQPVIPGFSRAVEKTANQTTSVAPLLGGIKWNQGEPFNNLCPVVTSTNKRTVTGCVATGMAQVMKYHQWPVTGTGSNSYTSETHGFQLSSDFAAVTFDWANMTDTYGSSSTEIQKNAVATLMYNCGVAVNMNYDVTSGASSVTMAKAMKTYFGYDPNLEYYRRNYYTREEWSDILRSEINAGRPLLYSGQSQQGGHLFVCDGYDANGFFHFNWGWGGYSDGYFRISALDPSEQGIGSSPGGYNSNQAIVVGLQKPGNQTTFVSQIYMNDTITYPADTLLLTDNITFTANSIFNYGINTFSGNMGLGLYNANNELITALSVYQIAALSSNYGWNKLNFNLNGGIPGTVTPGKYKLYVIFQSNNETDWQKVRTTVGNPAYVDVTVTETTIHFDTPADEVPNLELESMVVTGNLYNGKTGRITVKLKNSGKEYNSGIGIYLQSTTDENNNIYLRTENVNLVSGEIRELNFNSTIDLEPGSYFLSTMYDPTNNPDWAETLQTLGEIQTVNILPTPTGTPILNLNSKISFPNNSQVNSDFDILSFSLQNTGAYFDNKMIAFVFPVSGGSSLTYIGNQDVIIDTNETQNIQFKGALDLEPGNYKIALYYLNTENQWTRLNPLVNSTLNFTLTNVITGMNTLQDESEITVFPVPAKDNLYIKSENRLLSINVYNMTGQLLISRTMTGLNDTELDISKFTSGDYLLYINTEKGPKTIRFIKQ